MVGVLIRMRLRLMAHSLSGTTRVIAFVAGTVIGLAAALGTVFVTATTEHPFSVASLLFTVWTLGWILVPVLTAGSDETLQPEHFSLLPIRPLRLAFGLAVASVVGVAPIMTLIAFAGLLVPATSQGLAVVLVAAVGIILQLALAVLASRVVVGWLGSVLRSRRGRDLGVLLTAGVGLLTVPMQLLVRSIGPVLLGISDSPLGATLHLLPVSWSVSAVRAAADGKWLLTALLLGALSVLIGLLALLWSALLRRRLTTAARDSTGSTGKGGGGLLERVLPTTPTGAVLAKEVRVWWRDVRRRAVLFPALLIGLAMPLLMGAGNGSTRSILPYGGLIAAVLSIVNCANLYGFDVAALRQILVSPVSPHADIRGRQLGWCVYVAPVAVLGSLALPAIAGATDAYPWVLSLTPVALGAGSGAVVLLSVLAPYPAPERRGNPFASRSRPGCAVALKQWATTLMLVLVATPTLAVLLAGSLLGQPALRWWALPVGVLTGVVLAWWWGRIAARRLHNRGPELLSGLAR